MFETLTDVLRARAEQEPERLALVLLDGAADESARLTYAELHSRARSVAARLHGLVGRGDRVILLCPPDFDFIAAFFGCLYAGAVAVPVSPPVSAADLPRIEGIVADAQARALVTTGPLRARTTALSEGRGAIARLPSVALEDVAVDDGAGFRIEPASGDAIAFLQYTSGSVGGPKGVIVTHGNAAANQGAIQDAFDNDASRTVIASWLPLYHDMGLGTVLQALWVGTHAYLLSPLVFLQRPLVWLRAISRYRVTTTGGPNFAYELCVRRVTPARREGLDLSSWELAFNGAEPVRPDVLDRFVDAFAPAGFRRTSFYPCYGLAECVLFVSGGGAGVAAPRRTVDRAALERGEVTPADEGEGRVLVSCGRARPDHRVAIVDRETCVEVAPGRSGEIWFSGPSVCRGYWRREEEAAAVFAARLEPGGDGPFLRTGDLGFVDDGELYVTGRLKDVIIVRGKNHHAEDVERTAEHASPALRPGCSVAFGVDVDGEERLVVVCEIQPSHRKRLDGDRVAAEVRDAISTYHRVALHEAVLVAAGTVPKTSSGKVRRSACRATLLAGGLAPLWRG